jgi:hypothetical protein
MYDSNELPELVLGSRTQTPEAVNKVLEDSGYEALDVETQTDTPDEIPAATTDTTDSSVPASENGGDEAAGDEAGEIAEGEADSETAQQEGARPPRKGGYKKKIGKLAKEVEELKRQLAERSAAPAAEDLPEPGEEVPEPQLDDTDDEGNAKYASYEEYTKALSRWAYTDTQRQDLLKRRSARESKATETAADQANAEQGAAQDRWNEQLEVGKSKHDDFEEVLKQSKQMPAEVALTEALQDSDFSAELVYHLATHKDELDRLNTLLKLPAGASQADFRRKLRIAHREIDRLETLVSSGGADETAQHATDRSEDGAAPPQRTEAARESREKVAPKPAVETQTPPKKKPEPMRPVGSRGAPGRKRLQDLTPDEMHTMDPDDLRKLVELG